MIVVCILNKKYKPIFSNIIKRGSILFFMKKRMENRKGQIWVETVIYILIAFVMIGLVLSFVRPKIEELKDKAIIDQTIELMNNLDKVFSEVIIPGNKRIVEVNIRKGELKIDCDNDSLMFEIDSNYLYSEPGENIVVGNINVTTTEKGKYYHVALSRDYSLAYNITYKGGDTQKILSKSTVPYKVIISNGGEDGLDRTVIDLDFI